MRRLLVVFMVLPGAVLSAVEAPRLYPEPTPWLRWLGPVAPWRTPLPPLPSPLREPAKAWTREAALARALESNPDLQVALAAVRRQDGLRIQAMGLLAPRFGVSASTDWRDKSLIDRSRREVQDAAIVGQGLTAISTHGYDVRVDLRQTLFDGLASWHQVRRMALLEKKASVDARDLYLRLSSQVRQAYDAVLFRRLVVESRREGVADLRRLAEVARRRLTAGGISEFESLRAESAMRSAEAELAQAEAEMARAEEVLCRLLYVSKPAGGLQLAGTLAPLDYREAFPSALARAQAGRLDVKSAQLQLEAARLAQRVAAGSLFPKIEGYVNYGFRSSYYDVSARPHLEGWTVGLVARWDIFDGGQTVGSMRAQRAERRAAEVRAAEARDSVESQLRELFAGLEQSRSMMQAGRTARDLGERSVREAQRLYEVGRVPLEQVLNSEITYRQALVGWLGAVLTYNVTIYQLDYATANEAFLDAAVNARQ